MTSDLAAAVGVLGSSFLGVFPWGWFGVLLLEQKRAPSIRHFHLFVWLLCRPGGWDDWFTYLDGAEGRNSRDAKERKTDGRNGFNI